MERSSPTRFRDYLTPLVALVSLNALLGSSKLWIGFSVGSPAMRSNGWNNSADLIYSLLLAVGLWLSTRPADESHPEGHSRFESLVGMGVAMIILATGVTAIFDAVQSYWLPTEPQWNSIGLGLLVGSMGLKGLISYYLLKTSRQFDSTALKAIGYDQAADVLVDLSVIAAIASVLTGWIWIDPVVAGIIGLLIFKMGWEAFLENIHQLTGRRPSTELINQIRGSTDGINVFSEPYQIRAHYVGPALHVSLNVKAPESATLGAIHEAEEKLRETLLKEDDISRVFIHVEPHGEHSPN